MKSLLLAFACVCGLTLGITDNASAQVGVYVGGWGYPGYYYGPQYYGYGRRAYYGYGSRVYAGYRGGYYGRPYYYGRGYRRW